MGVALEGSLLSWEQIKPHAEKLKLKALRELLETWNETGHKVSEGTRWGDEVEYQIIRLNHGLHEAHLVLKQEDVLERAEDGKTKFEWQPEYAKYMAESAPAGPFRCQLSDMAQVHVSMAKRRKELKAFLKGGADPYTLTLFPLLGAPENKYEDTHGTIGSSGNTTSRFVPDEIISPRSRYRVLEANARSRKGRPMTSKIPIYRDQLTSSPWFDPDAQHSEVNEGQILLEGTIFGPGACGLQVTVEAKDVEEACELHDQLCVLGPVMLALTAGTPIFRGYLTDIDARWNTISQSYDDRTDDELQTLPPRWSMSPMYLSETNSSAFPTSGCIAEDSVRQSLEDAKMPPRLAHYYAHHFTRSMFLVDEDDLAEAAKEEGPDLWTRLAGTVFPHVRIKTPSSVGDGWRVEFRPMEVQFTDFENASLAVFVALFRMTVAEYKIDLKVPMEQLHLDMDKAHARDACLLGRFWWRCIRRSTETTVKYTTDASPTLQSIREIFLGDDLHTLHSGYGRIGLVGLVENYVNDSLAKAEGNDQEYRNKTKIISHLNFIRERASGRLPTGARWIRDIVRQHEDYAHDSKVTPEVCYSIVSGVLALVEADLQAILT